MRAPAALPTPPPTGGGAAPLLSSRLRRMRRDLLAKPASPSPMPAVPQPAAPARTTARATAAGALLLALALAAVPLAAVPLAAAAEPAPPAEPEAALLVDLDGRPADPLAATEVATVFLFIRTDCPISNRYAPEVRRLWEDFSRRGVGFYLVFADPGEEAATIRRSIADFDYPFPALRDPEHRLVARAGATVTPEVAVFDAAGTMVYRGRIDDRWASLGRPRPAPTRRDLADVLAALVAGEKVEPRTTKAVGCFIPELP